MVERNTRSKIPFGMGRKAEAKTVLKKALDIRVAELGEDNEITVDTRDEYEGLDWLITGMTSCFKFGTFLMHECDLKKITKFV